MHYLGRVLTLDQLNFSQSLKIPLYSKYLHGQHWNGTEREQSHAQLPAIINYVLHDEPHPFSFNRVMEPGFVLLLTLCLLLKSVTADDPSGTRCPSVPGREETCVCQTGGGIIDLTPYSNTDGTPRYSLTQPYGVVMVQYV